MNSFKEIVYKYGRNGKTETMEELTEMVNDFIEDVREHHKEKVEDFILMVDFLLNHLFSKEKSK